MFDCVEQEGFTAAVEVLLGSCVPFGKKRSVVSCTLLFWVSCLGMWGDSYLQLWQEGMLFYCCCAQGWSCCCSGFAWDWSWALHKDLTQLPAFSSVGFLSCLVSNAAPTGFSFPLPEGRKKTKFLGKGLFSLEDQ